MNSFSTIKTFFWVLTGVLCVVTAEASNSQQMAVPLTEIREAFDKYLDSGIKSTIEPYNRADLEFVLIRESQLIQQYDSLIPRYKAIERRISELQSSEAAKRLAQEKWFDRSISFILGILSALCISLFKSRSGSQS